ncbi:hypothetical protein GCM10009096_25550 [Parasphingorhabdus litoris]|uniref:Uncharacterized protein n=1 Tax=Parasphingorhabdus litoris TaxID=394733 RepID=A0ABN1AR82_9SPHN|nr:hypothetical protein [Parasphingorhabdus litoris]
MHARKIRYDDSFIAEKETKNVKDGANVASVNGSSTQYTASPARQLQQQLEAQYVDHAEAQPFEKYSGLSSISIIVASSLFMWGGLIALGLYIAR